MVWNKIHRHANGGLTGQSFRDTCATKDVAPTETHGWGDMTTYYFLILQMLKMVDFFQLDTSITFEIDTRWENSWNIFTISTGKGFLASTSTDQPCWNFVSASPSSASSPGSSCPRCPHRSRSSHIIAASYLYHTIHAWCYCGHSSENLETPESSLRLPQVKRMDSWIDRAKTMYIL